MTFVGACNDNTFCKKVKTLLTFIEITSLVTDPIAVAKTKKAAKEVVEEGLQNGWPSGMLDNIDGTTPKQKIQELSDIDILDYLAEYRERAKGIFLKKLSADTKSFQKYYSDSQLLELFTVASGKGLSSSDIAGIIHQACRVRTPPYIATMNELKIRMDNIIIVRERGYPFPFSSKIEFDNYLSNKVKPLIEMFGLPKNNIKYGGSGITSSSGFSPGTQDTDWWIFFNNKEEEFTFLKDLEKRYNQYIEDGNIKGADGRKKIKRMYERYGQKGYIDKEYITTVVSGQIVDLRTLKTGGKGFIENFFGATPTDISLKIKGDNEPIPSVLINLY